MVAICSRLLLISAISLASWQMVLAPVSSHAATKVKTKTLIIPDEKAAESPAPESGIAIPDDALPDLESVSPKLPQEDPQVPLAQSEEEESEPPVIRDLDKLPAPARRMRELILEAAHRGDIEGLRDLLGIGETATALSIGGLEGDPISFLKETSGDDEGYEILAILIEVLEAGFVHVDPGTENEIYIWPYFFAWPFDKLTPQMKVELYRILTAGDVQDSTDFGGYIFYRVGIKPDGHWDFFVAGD